MDMIDFLNQLEQTRFASAVAESTWLFPFFETVHVFTLSLVLGSVALVDMRLLGLAGRHRPVTEISNTVLPWTWAAFTVTALCGLVLFSSKATTYYVNLPFRIKMAALAFAGINMIVFHGVTARDVTSWDMGVPPVRARVAGAVSVCLWVVIAFAGRWIGFTR